VLQWVLDILGDVVHTVAGLAPESGAEVFALLHTSLHGEEGPVLAKQAHELALLDTIVDEVVDLA